MLASEIDFINLGLAKLTSASGRRPRVRTLYVSLSLSPILHYIWIPNAANVNTQLGETLSLQPVSTIGHLTMEGWRAGTTEEGL